MTPPNLHANPVIIDPELLAILCCPETKQPLALLDEGEVSRLNEQIQQGKLRNQSGSTIQDMLQGGLIRSDRRRVYPIRDNIPILLIEEGISVEGIL